MSCPRFVRSVLVLLLLASLQGVEYEERLIATFDTDAQGWQPVRAAGGHAAEDGGCLKLEIDQKGGGFAAYQALDCSGWHKLKFDIHAEGIPKNVSLVAVDADGKKYTSWYQRVAPGLNQLEYNLRGFGSTVPEKGAVNGLDVSRIASITLRVEGNIPGGVIYKVDNIRLTRGPEPSLVPEQSRHATTKPIPGNLLSNGDFELGLQEWGSWGKWDGGAYSFGRGQGDDVHTGQVAAAVFCQKKGRGGIFTTVDLKRADTYTLRFAVKGNGAERMRYSLSSVGDQSLHKQEHIAVSDEWTMQEVQWQQASPGKVRLYLMHVSEGSLFLDTVSVTGTADQQPSASQQATAKQQPSIVQVKGDRCTVNGKQFFPIGIYGVNDPAAELKDTGFNFAIGNAIGTSSDEWFLKCDEAGVMTIANMTGLMRAHLGAQAAQIVPQAADYASLFGYYLCDEPDHGRWNVTPYEIRQATDILHEADPNHPTVVLVMGWHRSMPYQYADAADIIASDPYSVDDMDKPVRNTLWMDDAQAGPQPVWTVLQAGWDKTEPLTPQALECQAYASIICGADGIFWFERQWCKRYPEQWNKIKSISRELATIHDMLCAEEPGAMQPVFSDSRIIGLLKQSDKELLLITVNKTLEVLDDVTITIPGLTAAEADEYFVDGNPIFEDGSINIDFKPGQRRVFRILLK